jgi:hypothetical protein
MRSARTAGLVFSGAVTKSEVCDLCITAGNSMSPVGVDTPNEPNRATHLAWFFAVRLLYTASTNISVVQAPVVAP